MHRSSFLRFLALALICAARPALAVHLDVELKGSGQNLTAGFCLSGSLVGCDLPAALAALGLPEGQLPLDRESGYPIFAARFGDNLKPNVTDNPGFQAVAGALSPGELIRYRASGILRYWDPQSGRWEAAPSGARIKLFGGLEAHSVSSGCPNGLLICIIYDENAGGTVFSGSGISGPESLIISQVKAGGAFHQHLDWFLEKAGGGRGGPTGAYLVTLQVVSDRRANPSQPFLIAFNNGLSDAEFGAAIAARINRAPIADAGADRTVPSAATVTLDGSGSRDAEGAIAAYGWSQTAGPAVSLSGAGSAMPQFLAPTVSADTELRFSLVVTDQDGAASAADTVSVMVTSNLAPTADAGPDRSVVEGSAVRLAAFATDPDGAIAAYQWTQTAGPGVLLEGADTATPGFTAPSVDADTGLQFRLIAFDDQGAVSDADVVTITVCDRDESGCKPKAAAGTDRSAQVGETVVLDGSASSDPQGQALSHEWSQTGGPPITLSGADTATAEFPVPPVEVNTVLSFQLLVTDPDGNVSDPDTVNVTINRHNSPPVADIAAPPAAIRAGATLVLDGSASYDPENDALGFHWTQTGGPPLELSSATAQRPSAVVPLAALGETLSFSLTVSDGQVESAATALSVAVTGNNPPSIELGAGPVVRQTQEVAVHASAQDPDGDGLHYHWEQIDGPAVPLSGADGAELRFTAPELERRTTAFLRFRLTVGDDFQGDPKSVSGEIEVTVTADGSSLDCSAARPSRRRLWPATRGLVPVRIDGITGPNPFAVEIISVVQDEPVRNPELKDRTRPDAKVVTPKATARKPWVKERVLLRAERQGRRKKVEGFSGNGRVYVIGFRADDGFQSCEGSVTVPVPPSRTGSAVADEEYYDSTSR